MDGTTRLLQTSCGPVYLRDSGATGIPQAPLLLLHPLPHSGAFFDSISALLAQERRVLRPDYPGFGASPSLSEAPSIERYAASMLAALEVLPVDGPVDVMGFHTGCLVGVEMALQRPARLRRLVLVDVPYFDVEEGVVAMEDIAKSPQYSSDVVAAFQAAMTYAAQERLEHCNHACLCVAMGSALSEVTERAAKALPSAALESHAGIRAPVMENGAELLLGIIRDFTATR